MTSSYYPTGNATLPRLHARGLANSGNMRFANAVLQLLMRSPAALKETRQSEGQRGGGVPETDGGVIEVTTRSIEQFLVKEGIASDTMPP